MKQDTIQGFQNGADDYITKPFVMEELLLRISAVLRRANGAEPKAPEPDQYRIGASSFEPRKQVLRTPAGERKLTTKESELLRLLCTNRNDVLERSAALIEVWGNDSYFNGRSMDVYIAKLRKYLRDDPAVEIINVHGKGFRLIAERIESARRSLILSDGLAMITLYLEPRSDELDRLTTLRRGATQLASRQLGHQRAVVVGEVPLTTAVDLANRAAQALND